MERKHRYLKISVRLPERGQVYASMSSVRLCPMRFERELLDGLVVASSLILYGFERVDGLYTCRYMDEHCNEFTINQRHGDFFDPSTGDWVYWSIKL